MRPDGTRGRPRCWRSRASGTRPARPARPARRWTCAPPSARPRSGTTSIGARAKTICSGGRPGPLRSIRWSGRSSFSQQLKHPSSIARAIERAGRHSALCAGGSSEWLTQPPPALAVAGVAREVPGGCPRVPKRPAPRGALPSRGCAAADRRNEILVLRARFVDGWRGDDQDAAAVAPMLSRTANASIARTKAPPCAICCGPTPARTAADRAAVNSRARSTTPAPQGPSDTRARRR